MLNCRLLLTSLYATLILASLTYANPPSATWFPKAPPLDQATGQVIEVTNVAELFQAAKNIEPNGTILLADGHYMMPRYFEIATDIVSMRSKSGNRHKVILDGAASQHGELVAVSNCTGVIIADLTIQNVKWNGFKINSDRGAQRVTIYNCVIHNIWQRGVKAPGLRKNVEQFSPRDCRVQYCLFYNDRTKQFSDDETDTPDTFNGNYIGGIDVKNTIDWKINDNVFIGIQGRTREGRGCIYISENGQGCVIERNIFLDCDIAIALGNPSLEYSKHHAVKCIARNNLVSECPETGILACYTSDCQISNNTVHEPKTNRQRLIWVQNANDGLQLTNNLLIGRAVQITSKSKIQQQGTVVLSALAANSSGDNKTGQQLLPHAKLLQAVAFPSQLQKIKSEQQATLAKAGRQPAEVFEAMKKVHSGFKHPNGYVAQFGDSITYSMAFWSAMGWSSPDQYLTHDDGLPKAPKNLRWRDYLKGTRDKGPKFANYSGWKVGQLNNAMGEVLKRDKPEVAIIMIGTNDISSGTVPKNYKEGLQQVIQKCLDAHCIPILNTIPPRRNREQAVEDINEIIRAVAKESKVPLADFHAECLRLRPGNSWDGTIISKDGVHPSGGKTNEYTEENMKNCGYALRNWVNFLVLRQLYFQVLNPIKDQ